MAFDTHLPMCACHTVWCLLPSIHFVYLLNLSRGGWSLFLRSSGTPWTGRQAITGPHSDKRDKHTLTLTPKDKIVETPINLTFLDGGRKSEDPERTHTYTWRTCKLHTERPQPGVEPGTLLLWGNGANHHTTVQWCLLQMIKCDERRLWIRGVGTSYPQLPISNLILELALNYMPRQTVSRHGAANDSMGSQMGKKNIEIVLVL